MKQINKNKVYIERFNTSTDMVYLWVGKKLIGTFEVKPYGLL